MLQSFLSALMEQVGYGGVFLATALEYGCFPISSEVLFPFLGYAVYVGGKSLPLAIVAATLGAMVGCSACYGVARFFGAFLLGIGKRFDSVAEAMGAAEDMLNQYGPWALCFGRLVPLVRTYISFPAGFGKMRFVSFLCSSAVGALIWNTALFSIGYFCGLSGTILEGEANGVWMIPVGVVLIGFFFCKKRKKQR